MALPVDHPTAAPDSRGFLPALIGDGRPLLSLVGIGLLAAGLFAILQSATGHFLPHDIDYLQMSATDLCAINECRIVHFMFHDRVSFGGVLIAIAVFYFWLAEFPLKARQPWAWRTMLASGVTGFCSFMTYLGYGYLDTWHGAATLLLLPCFVWGMWKLRPAMRAARDERGWLSRFQPGSQHDWSSRAGLGRACLLMAAAGTIGAGCTIQLIGMTSVFVDTDLAFMGLTSEQLNAINPRLIPLIAHDRAGFGGGLTTVGLLAAACVWFATPSRSLWQALLIAGAVGWTTAIGIHPLIGYTDTLHLAPAVTGAALYLCGLVLVKGDMYGIADESLP